MGTLSAPLHINYILQIWWLYTSVTSPDLVSFSWSKERKPSPSTNDGYHDGRRRPARPHHIPLTECRLGYLTAPTRTMTDTVGKARTGEVCSIVLWGVAFGTPACTVLTATDIAAVLSMKNKNCRSLKICSLHVHTTATSARSSSALMCCYCFSSLRKSSWKSHGVRSMSLQIANNPDDGGHTAANTNRLPDSWSMTTNPSPLLIILKLTSKHTITLALVLPKQNSRGGKLAKALERSLSCASSNSPKRACFRKTSAWFLSRSSPNLWLECRAPQRPIARRQKITQPTLDWGCFHDGDNAPPFTLSQLMSNLLTPIFCRREGNLALAQKVLEVIFHPQYNIVRRCRLMLGWFEFHSQPRVYAVQAILGSALGFR